MGHTMAELSASMLERCKKSPTPTTGAMLNAAASVRACALIARARVCLKACCRGTGMFHGSYARQPHARQRAA